MSYYTEAYLRNKARTKSRQFSKSFENLILESHQKKSFDIFLSHSYADKELISGIQAELEDLGYSVYVDWDTDSHLSREEVNEKTVLFIKDRMKQSASLIYTTSDNTSSSKWMPWELGFMDGLKGKCAILPVVQKSSDSFGGQEYLSVYPELIIKDDILFVEKLPVLSVSFRKWIKKARTFLIT